MNCRKKICINKDANKSNILREKGYLSVKVFNRLTHEPITFANVNVYFLTFRGLYGEEGMANLVAGDTTNENGEISLVELPVIDKRNSSIGTQYYMSVSHFRYHPVNLMNIQIYPNITVEYDVQLTPLTSPHPDYHFLISPDML